MAAYVYPDGDKGRALLASKGWGKEELAEKADVDDETVDGFLKGKRMQRKKLRAIADALKVPYEDLIVRAPEPAPVGYSDLLRSIRPLSPEIQAFGERHGVTPIDQYIQLRSSPSWLGWPRSRVATFPVVEEHEPLPEMRQIMDRFPPSGAINLLYGIKSASCDLIMDDEIEGEDEIPFLYLSATGGTWGHINALEKAWQSASSADPNDPGVEDCLAFHRKFEREASELIDKKQSRLYHNANTEAILITKDNQMVLARKSGAFSHGLWSASFEEQVLRFRKRDNVSDQGDLFACAHRGAFDEFGVTIIPEASRLLAMGIEWGNFTLAFIIILRCVETYDEIRNWSWENIARDPAEASAIDCIDTTNEEDIRRFFSLDHWTPSVQRAKRSNLLPRDAPDPLQPSRWHPVARARLLAYLCHKNATR